MDLPEKAADALRVVKRDFEDVRLELAKVCGSTRSYRLSVRYRAKGRQDEARLGLLYSDDRAALEALRTRLSAT
jgi:hypothetical protein